MPVKGGRKLRAAVKRAQRARGVSEVQVGFFASARYPNGTSVPLVAAVHEFGSKKRGIPERPYFRAALLTIDRVIRPIIRQKVNKKTLTVSKRTGARVGEAVKAQVQRSIVLLRRPANAPETIARKGSSNPLIDTGTLRTAVTYRLRQ